MKKLLALCLAYLVVGCATGSVEPIDICSSQTFKTVAVPAIFVGKSFKANFTTTNSDLSDALSKMKDLGDISVSLTSASFSTVESADLSFVNKIAIGFVNPDGSIEPLGETDVIAGSIVPLKFANVPANVQDALRAGPVNFKTTVYGVYPAVKVTPTLTVCISASSTIDATLSDLKK